MKPRNKPIELGPVAGVLLLPLLLIGGALSIPYAMIARRVISRRERRFTNSMRAVGRTLDWEHFIREIDAGHGTLIVERFSFKGPIRMWWTGDDVYEHCQYPLADWPTMAMDTSFDAARRWCHNKYTCNAGTALLVDCSKEQRRTIRGNGPFSLREGIQYLEVPPPRRSSQLS